MRKYGVDVFLACGHTAWHQKGWHHTDWHHTLTSHTHTDITRIDVTKIDVTRADITQIGISQLDITQIDIAQIGITQTDITQLDIAQIDITQVDVTQTGLARHFFWALFCLSLGKLLTCGVIRSYNFFRLGRRNQKTPPISGHAVKMRPFYTWRCSYNSQRLMLGHPSVHCWLLWFLCYCSMLVRWCWCFLGGCFWGKFSQKC